MGERGLQGHGGILSPDVGERIANPGVGFAPGGLMKAWPTTLGALSALTVAGVLVSSSAAAPPGAGKLLGPRRRGQGPPRAR